MAYWWVNQNSTFGASAEGGLLWSPKKKSGGTRCPFYDHMTQVQPGDVVFAYAKQKIRALAVVSGPHGELKCPESFKDKEHSWDDDGWMVPVQYRSLDEPLEVRKHMEKFEGHLPYTYSPIGLNGRAKIAYLCPVPEGMANVLLSLLKVDRDDVREWQDDVPTISEVKRIEQDETLTSTERKQLIKARVGQGVFRKNVCELEPVCRITGTADPKFLVASHIKPWVESENHQRLDGNNGLMLAPHIDRLFDRKLISFADDGAVILSPALPDAIRVEWRLEQKLPLKPFTPEQVQYLTYHRERLVLK